MDIDVSVSNPSYPHPIIFRDIKNGLEYISIDVRIGYIHEGIFLGEPFDSKNHFGKSHSFHVYHDIINLYGNGPHRAKDSLSELGVIQDNNGSWSKAFLIKNCEESRIEFAKWLSQNDVPRKENLISFMKFRYPEALEASL